MTESDGPGEAERRLLAAGIPMEIQDFGDAVDDGLGGCILAKAVEGGSVFKIAIRPGMEPWQRETFAEWAAGRFARFGEYGTALDDWQLQSDGETYQSWGRWTEMPSLG